MDVMSEIKTVYRVVGMRRSGQHAIIHWILRQCQGITWFVNDLQPGQNPESFTGHIRPFDRWFSDGMELPEKPAAAVENLVFNHEDWSIIALRQAAESLPSGWPVGNASEHYEVLVLRDPCNLFASRFYFQDKMPVDSQRWQWDDTGLWIEHAREFAGETRSFGNGQVMVNFNRWAAEHIYREDLAGQLGLKFTDVGVHDVWHIGSTFEPNRGGGEAAHLNTRTRWQQALHVNEYRALFQDARLLELAREIFGELEAIGKLTFAAPPETDRDQVRLLARNNHLEQARTAAQAWCAVQPGEPDNWMLLAEICAARNEVADVAYCCRKITELRPGDVAARYNLGVALQRLHRLEDARFVYEDLLRQVPDYLQVKVNLALVMREAGDLDGAAACCRAVLGKQPGQVRAGNTLGLVLMDQGRLDAAENIFIAMLEMHPAHPDIHHNLGLVYLRMERYEEARANLEKARELAPDNPAVYVDLGAVLVKSGDTGAAQEQYTNAVKIASDPAPAYSGLGMVEVERNNFEAALDCFRLAMDARPDNPVVLNNTGKVLVFLGRPEEATDYYRTSLSLNPDDPEVHWNYAWALLLTGDFEKGWNEYEWRLRYNITLPRDLNRPMWNGGALEGKKIFLYPEQGFGDTLQFLRYAKLVKERGAWVIVEIQPELHRLCRSFKDVDEWVIAGYALPDFDLHVPLMSLARLFNTRLDSIPAPIPYLHAPPLRSREVKQLLDTNRENLRIGIAWSGNPEFSHNDKRSCHVSLFKPLSEMAGVSLYSLQKGAAAGDLRAPDAPQGSTDLSEFINDFADTASIMAELDLIVTTDTSVAHLAGALGL